MDPTEMLIRKRTKSKATPPRVYIRILFELFVNVSLLISVYFFVKIRLIIWQLFRIEDFYQIFQNNVRAHISQLKILVTAGSSSFIGIGIYFSASESIEVGITMISFFHGS